MGILASPIFLTVQTIKKAHRTAPLYQSRSLNKKNLLPNKLKKNSQQKAQTKAQVLQSYKHSSVHLKKHCKAIKHKQPIG